MSKLDKVHPQNRDKADSDDFLEVMELKLAECQKNLHQFESSIQMMQQALAEIKQKQ